MRDRIASKRQTCSMRHVEEVSDSVAATCRYYGISRQCYYVWQRRFDEEEVEGLNDRSSAPHHQPAKTSPEAIEKILWLRQQYRFGPKRITVALACYHEVTINPLIVWRMLHQAVVDGSEVLCAVVAAWILVSVSVHSGRAGHARPQPASGIATVQTHADPANRYEKQRPAHQLQEDVKFIEPLG